MLVLILVFQYCFLQVVQFYSIFFLFQGEFDEEGDQDSSLVIMQPIEDYEEEIVDDDDDNDDEPLGKSNIFVQNVITRWQKLLKIQYLSSPRGDLYKGAFVNCVSIFLEFF